VARLRLFACLLLASCATSIPGVTPDDANADAWGDAMSLPPGTIIAGGSHDTGSGGCVARILVIFDRSGSMGDAWMSSGPKWQVAEMALATAITPRETQLSVGAIMFPSEVSRPSSVCSPVDPIASQIPFAPGTDFLATWSSYWMTAGLLGSTPIDSAFDSADAALTGAGHETAVVLMTDGEPTCSGTVSAETRAASWLSRGIKTFVVGLPGSSTGMATLSAIASAGGTTVISVDDPSVLTSALGSIATTHVQTQCP
jgi:hypothetical protein